MLSSDQAELRQRLGAKAIENRGEITMEPDAPAAQVAGCSASHDHCGIYSVRTAAMNSSGGWYW